MKTDSDSEALHMYRLMGTEITCPGQELLDWPIQVEITNWVFQTVNFSKKIFQNNPSKNLFGCITRSVSSVLKPEAYFCGLYTPFYSISTKPRS